MKKLIVLLFFALLGLSGLQAQTTWKIDPYHSNVNFSVTHLVISEVDGSFKVFNGTIVSPSEDFSDAKIDFTVDIASVNTDNEKRDNHLNSEDFFYTEKYPQMQFTSSSFKKIDEGKYLLHGNLTMRGITKEVTLDVKYGGILPDDGYGNTKAGFIVSGTLNRMDYGIAWNGKTEHGTWIVGEDVNVLIKLEFVKQ